MRLNLTSRHRIRSRTVLMVLITFSWSAAEVRADVQSKRAPGHSAPAHEPFSQFAEELAAEWMRADPTAATVAQYFTGPQQAELDRQLTAKDSAYSVPLTEPRRVEYVRRIRRALTQLQTYPRSQ